MKRANPTLRVLGFLKGQKKRVGLLVCLALLVAGFDILVPFISQKLIDTLIEFFKRGGNPPIRVLILSALGILAATVFSRTLNSTYNYQLFQTVTQAEDKVEERAFEKYLRLHALYHHRNSGGQMIGRIERGATGVYSILNDIFGQSLLPPLTVFAGVLIALLFKSFWISLAVFLPLPVYVFAIQRLTRSLYEMESQATDGFEAISKQAYDVAANVLTVKKFCQERAEAGKKLALRTQVRAIQYRAARLWELITGSQALIATLGKIAVIFIGGIFALKGKCTVGEFVLYVTLQNMAYQPLSQLSSVFPRLRRNISRVERLFEVMDQPIDVTDAPYAINLPPFHKQIEFRNVWFRYPSARDWAIENVSVTIPAGHTVAIVGRSGSGKTTFVNLLLRSFDPQKGVILVDGHDLRDVTQESLRNQIAVVPQEVELFSRTIAENLAFGRPNATPSQMRQAAKIAQAHEFIENTELGYDTTVGERGMQLSGGERQRIGIGRAVLRDPEILIFDEATSHLDPESERLVQKATRAVIENRTAFIIAHRLSTVTHAGQILVFNEGKIEAMGTHGELLKKSRTYERLNSVQPA